ncbi:MAG: hypothetical protein WCA08_25375, partial [Desulfoferrobacter sp.]
DKNEVASYQLILIRAGNCCFPEFSDLSVTVRQADELCHRSPAGGIERRVGIQNISIMEFVWAAEPLHYTSQNI